MLKIPNLVEIEIVFIDEDTAAKAGVCPGWTVLSHYDDGSHHFMLDDPYETREEAEAKAAEEIADVEAAAALGLTQEGYAHALAAVISDAMDEDAIKAGERPQSTKKQQ
jgi:hypothetical protein